MPARNPVDPTERAKVLYVRCSQRTHEAVTAHAQALGIGPGDLVRYLVEREVYGWPHSPPTSVSGATRVTVSGYTATSTTSASAASD